MDQHYHIEHGNCDSCQNRGVKGIMVYSLGAPVLFACGEICGPKMFSKTGGICLECGMRGGKCGCDSKLMSVT